MWVIAVGALVVVLGIGLLGLLAWRVVARPGLALSRAVTSVAAQAGEALTLLADRGVQVRDTPVPSGRRLPNEGIDVPLEATPGEVAEYLRGKV